MSLSNLVDGHGHIDVFKDSNLPSEIKVLSSKQGHIIQGCTFNMLLRGLFELFCNYKDGFRLPGGIQCWETIVEPVFVSLLYLATSDEIMSRVRFIIRQYYDEQKEEYKRGALGSMYFLFYWLQCYSSFISDINLYRIHYSVEKLSKLFDISSHIEVKNGLFLQLRNLTSRCVRSRNKCPDNVTFSDPNLSGNTKGRWNGQETQLKRKQMLESLAKAPKLKLEIFGGDMIMERFAGDSDDESQTDTLSVQQKQVVDANPVSHIQDGLSLLRPPSMVATDLLSIDTLELARQWTLLDHALFAAIPLHSLMAATTASYTQARHKLVRTGIGNCGIVGGARWFIDRFNASSLWVTHSVLSRNSPEERGAAVSQFIRLAGHMLDLCNFNGLMVILTALQQGCISRLVVTFANVAKSEKTLLVKLQRLTAGSKNYQKYREEVSRLVPTILSGKRGGGGGGGGQERDATGGDDLAASMEWRKHIYETHYDTSTHVSSSPSTEGGDGLQQGSGSVGGDIGFGLDDHLTADKTTAIVPHIGAHLAELASITEGNADFVADCPHLFNIHKLCLLAATMSTLRKMQSMRYQLTPLRNVAAAINLCVKRHMKLLSSENTDHSTRLFEWSAAKETALDIDAYLTGAKDVVTASTAATPSQLSKQIGPEELSVTSRVHEESHTSASSSRQKYRKSDAYDSILSGTTSSRVAKRRAASQVGMVRVKSVHLRTPAMQPSADSDDDEEHSSGGGDEEETDKAPSSKTFQGPHRFLRQASTLMRTMSFVNRS